MQYQYYEEYVKNNLGIPNVNFSKLDISVIMDIIEALEEVVRKFPALKKTICAFGSNEDINNQYNMIANSNKRKKVEWEDFIIDEGETMSSVRIGTHIPILMKRYVFEIQSFIAIAYGEFIFEKNIEQLNQSTQYNSDMGYHPRHCNKFKSVIYHEVGHILDFTLNLSKDKQLITLIHEKSNGFKEIGDKISYYAMKPTFSDIIAEAFSEYMFCPNSNDLIMGIGRYIEEKYKLFEESQIFDINKKYHNHLTKKRKY